MKRWMFWPTQNSLHDYNLRLSNFVKYGNALSDAWYENYFDQRSRALYPVNFWTRHFQGNKTAFYRTFEHPYAQYLIDNWEAWTLLHYETAYTADHPQYGIILRSPDDSTRWNTTDQGFDTYLLRIGSQVYLNIMWGDDDDPSYSTLRDDVPLADEIFLWESNVNVILQDNGQFSDWNVNYEGDYQAENYGDTDADHQTTYFEDAWYAYSVAMKRWAAHNNIITFVNTGAAKHKLTADPIWGETSGCSKGWHEIHADGWDGMYSESFLWSATLGRLVWDNKASGAPGTGQAGRALYDSPGGYKGTCLRKVLKRTHYRLVTESGYIARSDAVPSYAIKIVNTDTVSHVITVSKGKTLTVTGETPRQLDDVSSSTISQLTTYLDGLSYFTADNTGCYLWITDCSSRLLTNQTVTITAGSTGYLSLQQPSRDAHITRIAAVGLVGVPDWDKVFLFSVGTFQISGSGSSMPQESDVFDAPDLLGASLGTSEAVLDNGATDVTDPWMTLPNYTNGTDDCFYHEYENGMCVLNWTSGIKTINAEDFGSHTNFYSLRHNLLLPGVAWESLETVDLPPYYGDILFWDNQEI